MNQNRIEYIHNTLTQSLSPVDRLLLDELIVSWYSNYKDRYQEGYKEGYDKGMWEAGA